MTTRKETRWYNLVQRLIKEARDVLHPVSYDWELGEVKQAHHKDGVVRVTLDIYLTGDGDPIFWIVDKSSKIEPSKDARQAILSLFGERGVDEEIT